MNRFALLLFVLLSALIEEPPVVAAIKTKHLPQGYFGFEYCAGKIVGGSPICYQHTIRIQRKQVFYSIDGYQTKRRFTCALTGDLRCLFNTYGQYDSRGQDDIKPYQELFHLEKLPGKFLFTKFRSPSDGKLVQTKYLLKRKVPKSN